MNNLLIKKIFTLRIYSDIRVVRLLFLGFSSGLPILLIFSTLSLWLKSAGVDKSTITLFSWAGLSYGFKFMWAPLIDRLSIPYFSQKFGHRKSWLFSSQLILVLAIINVGFVDPSLNLTLMAMSITLVGFASATQDTLIDTYRIESAPNDLQAAMSSFYIIGYRIGMIISGAGSLYIVSLLGGDSGNYNVNSWQNTYLIMAGIQIIGIVTCIVSPEPDLKRDLIKDNSEKFKLLTTFFIGISLMVLIYTNLPGFDLKNIFLITTYKLSKFLISLVGAIVIFYSLIKIKFVKKSTINETFI